MIPRVSATAGSYGRTGASNEAMPRLTTSLLVPRPLNEVFPFFAAAENLQRITPPWVDFRIVTPLPIAMRVGALIDYRLEVHSVPFGWRTEITAWGSAASLRRHAGQRAVPPLGALPPLP